MLHGSHIQDGCIKGISFRRATSELAGRGLVSGSVFHNTSKIGPEMRLTLNTQKPNMKWLLFSILMFKPFDQPILYIEAGNRYQKEFLGALQN